MFVEFHFLRPYWFFAMLPILIVIAYLLKQRFLSRQWEAVCDRELLPYILIGHSGARQNRTAIIMGLTSLLTVTALAGPAWERLPRPVFQKESALVIALDLSLSMLADDVTPSRLERARFEITDLLDVRQEGQTALLVYAGDAFVVTPLTDDTRTIKSQLPALSPFIMPVPGSDTGRALALAADLLNQAGMRRGDILFITDEIEMRHAADIEAVRNEGYRVSILAIGTDEGAPIKLGDGNFLEDSNGAIVIPGLDASRLKQLSSRGGGKFEISRIQDDDSQSLNRSFNTAFDAGAESEMDFETDQWYEFGPALALLLIPFAALVFRRGFLSFMLCALLFPRQDARALDWDALWLNDNQRAKQALEQGTPERAAALFRDNNWKAAASYHAGDFSETDNLLSGSTDMTNIYNRANALAKQGDYQGAIEQYQRVLGENPGHADANYNKELVERELQQQQGGQSDEQAGQQGEQQPNAETHHSAPASGESVPQPPELPEGNQEEQQSGQDEPGQQASQQREPGQTAEEEQQSAGNEQSGQDESKQQASQRREPGQTAENEADAQQANQHEIDEQQQSTEQWLRRIPDDPSGLLERKFKYQYQQRRDNRAPSGKNW